MNIFYVDRSPGAAARALGDRHVVKMISESAQMLANCFDPYLLVSDAPYTQKREPRKYSYFNHGCSVWVRQSSYNFSWLLSHALTLCDEYKYRYERTHFTERFILWVAANRNEVDFPKYFMTPVYLAMPKKYHSVNPVDAYRLYYLEEKSHLHTYTKREAPKWMSRNLTC